MWRWIVGHIRMWRERRQFEREFDRVALWRDEDLLVDPNESFLIQQRRLRMRS